MKNLLKIENVRIIKSVENWQEAIKVGVLPLVQSGHVEERYTQAIIDATITYGPYYVVCEDLALLHAGTDKGVNEKQISVTLLKEPIKFKEDGYDVRLLITLAATDSESHLKAMMAISNIFIDDNKIVELINAKNVQQIYDLMNSSSEEEEL